MIFVSVRKYALSGSIVLLLGLCLTACIHIGSSGSEPAQSYVLTDLNQQPIRAPSTGKVVLINTGESLPRVRSTSMLYQQENFHLKEYALHRWLAAPATMISPILAKQLTDTGAFKAVINAPVYAGLPDYQVCVVLQQLQQNFTGQHSKEVLTIQLILINMKINKAIAAKTFTAQVEAAPNAPGGVVAANQALSQLMPDMVQFVINQLH